MRIAINGMGRIGRLLLRRLLETPGIEIVAVNDIMPIDNLFYLIKYDSIYGTTTLPFLLEENNIVVYNKKIARLQQPNPSLLPWKALAVDVVLECTGQFNSQQQCLQHIKAGAKKVLLSTTGDAGMPLLIYGYNQQQLTNQTIAFSPGGCMTNCSTPVLDILHKNLEIETVHINFLHSYTSRQTIVDAPNKVFRRGRAAAESIIPVPIDQQQTLAKLLPALKGKIAATSTRVPVGNGAMADCYVVVKNAIAVAALNKIFQEAATQQYAGILQYVEDEVVSADMKGNTHSAIVDGTLTTVLNHTHIKIAAWFDNEYGFTSRMIDWLQYWKTVG
jgi:glyceraldehyde 3-phosphate dehydrogenase